MRRAQCRKPRALPFPDYEIADWLAAAKRTMTLGGNGRIVFDYDMKIAEPLAEDGPHPARSICGPASMRWPASRCC